MVLAPAHRIARGSIDTEALKCANPIADVVAGYGIELRRQGRALVGRCPLHDDRGRPNLFVYADSGSWRCYRCNVGGDAITFVELVEQVPFREAAERLSGDNPRSLHPPRVARPYPRPRAAAPTERSSDETAALQAALSLYHSRLLGDPDALAYVRSRGIDQATIATCQVGYAAGDQLLPLLRWRAVPLWAALRTGLMSRAGREHLAGRVVVPELRGGRAVWFIGRLLAPAQNEPRFLGLPGPKPLLGWEQTRRQPSVCATEGVFDFLTLRMWGYPAVALLGTDVRQELLDDLRAFRRVYLVLDGDDAGVEATIRLQEQVGPTAVAVALPDGVKDVGELAARPDGSTVFAAALLEAVGASPPA